MKITINVQTALCDSPEQARQVAHLIEMDPIWKGEEWLDMVAAGCRLNVTVGRSIYPVVIEETDGGELIPPQTYDRWMELADQARDRALETIGG